MIHVRVPEKIGKANNTTVEMTHRREQQERLPGESLRTNTKREEEALKVIAAKLRRKILIKRLIREGRANDRPDLLFQAIDLGSYPARADFALVCFTANLPHQMCKNAFELLKAGRDYGCPDCTGMLAFYYVTGCRGVTHRCDDTAYSLACQSAAGSWFGKMALVHFLNSLLGVQDPDEETFYVCWTDPFICNFASRSIDVPAPAPAPAPVAEVRLQDVQVEDEDPFKDWTDSDLENWFEPDKNVLTNSDIRRIARLLIEEIQKEHQRNPDSPKVWLNLPAL
jgi:hypothetical protein